jgi:phage terminase small subunit
VSKTGFFIVMSVLTPKQDSFCQKYIELGNASEAYRQSYDASDMKPETVNRKAKELLDNGKIAARIEELKARQLRRHDVTIERVVEEYSKLAFLDIRKVFDEEGNLRPVHELDPDTAAAISGLEIEKRISAIAGPDVQSHTHKIKLTDKKGALDSLAKYLGMFVEKTEISGPGGGPIVVTKEQRDAAVKAARDADS